MTESGRPVPPEADPDLTLDEVVEGREGPSPVPPVGDDTEGTGAPRDAVTSPDEIVPELAEPDGDPGNRVGVHDRAGDTQDYS